MGELVFDVRFEHAEETAGKCLEIRKKSMLGPYGSTRFDRILGVLPDKVEMDSGRPWLALTYR